MHCHAMTGKDLWGCKCGPRRLYVLCNFFCWTSIYIKQMHHRSAQQ